MERVGGLLAVFLRISRVPAGQSSERLNCVASQWRLCWLHRELCSWDGPSALSQVGERDLAFTSLDVGSSRNGALRWFKNMFTNYLTFIPLKGGAYFPSLWTRARLSESLLTNRMWQKWWQDQVITGIVASSWTSTEGRKAAMLWGCSSSPRKKPTYWETKASCPQPF